MQNVAKFGFRGNTVRPAKYFYSEIEVERLLAAVGVDWVDGPSDLPYGELRRLRLEMFDLRRIIEQLDLPVELTDWTDEHKVAFKLAL